MLDFRIQTFIMVCQLRNFTRAAQELCITQPTVTQHIQYLEQKYGAKLLLYQNRNVILTRAGEELLRVALKVYGDEQQLKEEIRRLSGKPARISFGATMTIGEFVLPKKLARLMEYYPQMDISMVIENTRTLLNMIDEGKLPFAAVEGYFPRTEYDYQVFEEASFLPVCAAGRFRENVICRLEQLFDEPLLVREEGSGNREILERLLRNCNCEIMDFKHLTEVNNLTVLKELLLDGRGISFLYRHVVEEELEKGTLQVIPVENFQLCHEYAFVWRKGSAYREEYLTFFRELWGEQMLP